MRKIVSLLLSVVLLLTGCAKSNKTAAGEKEETVTVTAAVTTEAEIQDSSTQQEERAISEEDVINSFSGLSDADLLRYVEDDVYIDLVTRLDSDEYFVEYISAIYLSKEYLEELEYNSQANVYFGYTLAELDEVFQGKKYVFTLGDDNTTVVKEMEVIEEKSYYEALKNVAIGTGVILICVTVSVLTAGSAPAVSMIFAASAKSAATFALSTGVISGVSTGIITGIETGDFEEALYAGVNSASEGYKWGAITGAITGGAGEAIALKGATTNGLTMNEAAAIQRESGYPLDVIKQFHSVEEYEIYKEAGLYTKMINGKLALVRDIDLEYVSELPNGESVTNLVRMQKGYAPIDPITQKAYQLHHINQSSNGTLAILTETEHLGNADILVSPDKASEINRQEFDAIRRAFWKYFATTVS